ncbi:hypothetical protein K3152_02945 [Qipengyuania sp. 1NDH17]|uniref:TRAP transporter small permease subunit n=1 Tax=Qipengyuania polymorpha TaxID=2867234 RepID=A0ABS7IZG6_9SPHN|nr:hypothetical protein [Qipengyuania polymorpha]MBX7457194.1 hypothetical protein [Qipengyuania polymorpha]
MIPEFWPWFFKRTGRQTGLRALVSKWLILDIAVAAILTFFLRIDGFGFAEKALFPAASILVGMAVAWTARAAIIINDKDFRSKFVREENPIEDYVYGYQTSILILFSAIVYIAIMAAGGFDFYIWTNQASRLASGFFMYALISLTIRECWSVINFTNLLSLLSASAEPRDEPSEE